MIEIPVANGIEYAEAFAQENGFRLTRPPVQATKDYIFLWVDGADPGLAEFYTWREIAPGKVPPREGWRPFIWSEDDIVLNRFLEGIILASPGHTPFSVLASATKALP